jgi:hypothetical protein
MTGGPISTRAAVEASADDNSAGARAHDGFYPYGDDGFHRGTNQGISFKTLTHLVTSFYHLLPQTRSVVLAEL